MASGVPRKEILRPAVIVLNRQFFPTRTCTAYFAQPGMALQARDTFPPEAFAFTAGVAGIFLLTHGMGGTRAGSW